MADYPNFAGEAQFKDTASVPTPPANNLSLYSDGGVLKTKNSSGVVILLDAPINKFVTANQDVTNSATFTDSTDLQVDLIASATYDFQTYELVGSSAFATAGAQSQLAYTGTGTFYGVRLRAGNSGVEPINITPSWSGSSDTVNGAVNEPTKSLLVQRLGRIVTTTSGVLKVQFRQSTAVAAHYARLHIGSYLQVRRVS